MVEQLTIRVGDVVVFHDSSAPYEPREGRVMHTERLPDSAGLCKVRLSDGTEVYPERVRVHRAPLDDPSTCAWCTRGRHDGHDTPPPDFWATHSDLCDVVLVGLPMGRGARRFERQVGRIASKHGLTLGNHPTPPIKVLSGVSFQQAKAACYELEAIGASPIIEPSPSASDTRPRRTRDSEDAPAPSQAGSLRSRIWGLDELKMLADLRDADILSEEEFQRKKRILFEGLQIR